MSFFSRFKNPFSSTGSSTPSVPPKKRWWRIALFFVILLLIAGAVFFFKAGSILNKISTGKDGFLKGLVKTLPGSKNELQGEEAGRINILLLAMRGENVPGGGLLADTIMVLSIHPSMKEGDPAKASLVSIPRDLYVTDPGTSSQSKINAVYAYGEEREHGKGGMEDMEKVVGDVTGLNIPYAVVINFQGFIDLVNALDGVAVHLDEPFSEAEQFREPHICDANIYTVPTKPPQYEYKYYTRTEGTRYISAAYLLCYNKAEECGGVFELPAGDNTLDGYKALCFARARYQTNDFERAKRQQKVIQALKEKALSLGTLTDFSKINGILDSLGDNVRTNLEVWEMKELLSVYQKNPNPVLTQKVLDNSEAGLLYDQESKETGYILRARGDNYDQIHALFQGLP